MCVCVCGCYCYVVELYVTLMASQWLVVRVVGHGRCTLLYSVVLYVAIRAVCRNVRVCNVVVFQGVFMLTETLSFIKWAASKMRICGLVPWVKMQMLMLTKKPIHYINLHYV